MSINELEFNFLNKVIKDSNGNPALGQLLKTKALQKKVVSKICSIEELKEIYNKSKSNKNLVVDFSFSDNYLKCDNVPSVKLADYDIKAVKGMESVNEPVIQSIYDLFEILVDANAFLVGEDITESGSNMTDSGIARFLPIYSQSTMTVYISLKLEDNWKTIKLIYAEKGTLRTGKFFFAIPSNKTNKLESFPVDLIKSEEYNGILYNIYCYTEGLLTIAYNMDDVQIFPSIINRYMFMSELYKQIIRMCSSLSMRLTEAAYWEIHKPDYSGDKKDNVSRYTNGFVKISLRFKQLTGSEISGLIIDCLTNVIPKVDDGSMDTKGLMDYVATLNLSAINRLVYITLAKILANGGRKPLDRLEFTVKEQNYYKNLKFKVDTILYMLRANLFVVPVKLTDGDYQILIGSDAPYTSIIERRKG